MKKLFKSLSVALLASFVVGATGCIEAPKSKEPKKDLSSVVDDEELNEEMAEAVEEPIQAEDLTTSESSTDAATTEEAPRAVNVNVNTAPTSANGSHLVVVGSFIMEDNAKKLVERLKNQGFMESEVTIFDFSSYYTVLAGRYENESTASSVVDEFNSQFPELEKGYVLSRN